MKIILATGIYPPAIGGPATYSKKLADRLTRSSHDVIVVTYGNKVETEKWKVENVLLGLPILRWWKYSKKLKEVGKNADVVYAFSSISCGIPIILSRLRCKRILRLGGDFFWERYTAMGGKKGLREWYRSSRWQLAVSSWLLNKFDHVVFSTDFQQQIYKDAYKNLPKNSVIENALALDQVVPMEQHFLKKQLRLLFVGRFVNFKNIPLLIEAVAQIPDAYLTLVGSGPQDDALRKQTERLELTTRVQFVAPLRGKEKFEIFGKHDLLVIPSLTDISPNTALEARSVGLPALLTEETGLSEHLRSGIVIADLSTPQKITEEINRIREGYNFVSEAASKKIEGRSWEEVSKDTEDLFATICV
ncbi:MAG: glycosyltransferase family 4 protein [Candidatus Peribacteraceae bacterium]|jgi:glycosyltransferase involved in cell wall biosynthesis|nr:glycosyltransferase family 4 protein [Candidatus Peribacteraceae bacterium]|tara:strand:+ start:29760 stop:30842 length:1083 start_codon:yes stop_codon:yes gene_type:complete